MEPEQLVVDGKAVTRTQDLQIPAHMVTVGDTYIHGLPVQSVATKDSVTRIKAFTDKSGIDMEVSAEYLLDVTWVTPVLKGQCRECGKPAKYRDLCAAHYQAQRRAARSVPGPGQNSQDVELPFETSVSRRNADRQADY